MSVPSGFDWNLRKNGELAITRDGRVVAVLRGRTAERLERRLRTSDDSATQHLLARATGNYRRGNERT